MAYAIPFNCSFYTTLFIHMADILGSFFANTTYSKQQHPAGINVQSILFVSYYRINGANYYNFSENYWNYVATKNT